ncbi:GNAT family acetyltransferase [Xenorhabdus beddingii]|uniref:GNAT family acetyltransferase n=1 Tax=Xenorhabdus beddingii TaxID=40578 RepID=A0A1Y2SQK6_9GAMM|nr:GNAT family N-acetyltransferase [Xenorhabdus beddingii]OTA20541.1 GNAT family acetyltransferase [Xenorhabdus beddingii]
MLSIREATIEDAMLLSQLFETSYRFHLSHLWQDKDELEEYLAQECSIEPILTSLTTANHKWLIAESRSGTEYSNTHCPNIVGFGKIVFNQPVPDHDFTGVYLHKLYLMPHLTGQKQGNLLFDHLVKLGRERGQKWLWLEVLEQNTSAIKFYVRKGMKWQKDIIFSSPKQRSTVHIMVKNISQSL